MIGILKKTLHIVKINKNQLQFTPTYRVLNIIQDEDGDYIAHVQIINKNQTLRLPPEEILENDDLVNQFSPCDVRTLTYLGYLGINAPKYKILAKRLKGKNNVIFAIKKKGDNNIILKSASEILKESDFISNMQPDDAQEIGYTVAMERQQQENAIRSQNAKLINDSNKE